LGTRIGMGYDAHRFQEGVPLWIGGVKIEYQSGLAGHSDGDVLIHALIDAVLGAAGMDDIGKHFPPSEEYRGYKSTKFLEIVATLLDQSGWKVINLDATIIAERPRLSIYSEKMCRIIADSLNIDISAVNIKSTTTDGMGFIGEGQGIAAMATAMIESKR